MYTHTRKHKHTLGRLRYYETQKAFQDNKAEEGKHKCHGITTHRDPFSPRQFDIIDNAGCVSLHCECDTPREVEEWVERLAAAAIGATFLQRNVEHKSARAQAAHSSQCQKRPTIGAKETYYRSQAAHSSTHADAATTEHEISSQLPPTQSHDNDGEDHDETREVLNLSKETSWCKTRPSTEAKETKYRSKRDQVLSTVLLHTYIHAHTHTHTRTHAQTCTHLHTHIHTHRRSISPGTVTS